MTTILGVDWNAWAATLWGGRLASATLTRRTVTGYNPADPAGAPVETVDTYTCDAVPFAYKVGFIDGETIKRGDYQVTILRGTVRDGDDAIAAVEPEPGDELLVPPPGSSTPKLGRIVDVPVKTEAFFTCQVRGVA